MWQFIEQLVTLGIGNLLTFVIRCSLLTLQLINSHSNSFDLGNDTAASIQHRPSTSAL